MTALHRIAVVDLGTNTFHLLVAEITGILQWTELERERIFVNLASEGIETISEQAMQRGIDAMRHFNARIRSFGIEEIVAVGTAALRTARNAGDFLTRVFDNTGIPVSVISGNREAELIAKGVLSALPHIQRPALIMDIGGGSVEMILTQDDEVLFSASYPVGVAVLYANFHHEEPIAGESLTKLDKHLKKTFSDLLERLATMPDAVLVGASGTFEVVESILDPQKDEINPPYSTANPSRFSPIYREIVALDLEARLAHPEIPNSRAKYIVVAVHLIEFMLRQLSKDIFYISAYAMKEGIVVEASVDLFKSVVD